MEEEKNAEIEKRVFPFGTRIFERGLSPKFSKMLMTAKIR